MPIFQLCLLRRSSARPSPQCLRMLLLEKNARATQPPTDRFLGCDVRVRDYLREGGAVLRVTKIEVDDARLQLNIHHEYGRGGKLPRRYLRGDTEDEMRKNLRGTLDEFAAAAKAAMDGRAWYVIAARKVMSDRARPAIRRVCGRRSSSRFRGKMQTHHVLSVCRPEQARS